MANPRYHDDPEWYERPGETVHLEVDQHSLSITVPALPWLGGESMADRASAARVTAAVVREMASGSCAVCHRPVLMALLCPWCARAQQRDETHKARANQPQPSRSRISIREGWEVWASAEPHDTEDLESGHVRAYETRIG